MQTLLLYICITPIAKNFGYEEYLTWEQWNSEPDSSLWLLDKRHIFFADFKDVKNVKNV